MKNQDCHECKADCADQTTEKSARRKFLQTAAAAAGGLVLGVQMTARAEGETPQQSTPAANIGVERQFLLPQKVLQEVGAFEVVESGEDKIIVARTGPASIVACSAVCTHKGCIIGYEHESQQFVCPCHGARFETSGKVAKGPAKRDLKSYQTRVVLGVSSPTEEAN